MQQDQITASKPRSLNNVIPDIFLLLESWGSRKRVQALMGCGVEEWKGGSQEGGDSMKAQIAFIWALVLYYTDNYMIHF